MQKLDQGLPAISREIIQASTSACTDSSLYTLSKTTVLTMTMNNNDNEQ
jgi:hypothetical protein